MLVVGRSAEGAARAFHEVYGRSAVAGPCVPVAWESVPVGQRERLVRVFAELLARGVL